MTANIVTFPRIQVGPYQVIPGRSRGPFFIGLRYAKPQVFSVDGLRVKSSENTFVLLVKDDGEIVATLGGEPLDLIEFTPLGVGRETTLTVRDPDGTVHAMHFAAVESLDEIPIPPGMLGTPAE